MGNLVQRNLKVLNIPTIFALYKSLQLTKKNQMGKLDELVEKYQELCKKNGLRISADLLRGVAKSQGPSLYKSDAAKVACSDKAELATIKKGFLKKIGVTDEAKADKALADICEKMKPFKGNKQRTIFYALLAKKFKQESMFTK